MVVEWNKLGKMPVYFDGYDLSNYLNVISLDRGIGVSRVNNLLKAGIQKGKRYSSFTYDEKEILMEITLVQDLISKRRELAGILNVNEPKELIFGDEPDKFYMAIPDGNINLEELAHIGRSSIKWIVPDGVAHSVEYSSFTTSYIQPEKINVINRGTEICKPLLEATMRSDNGLVAFIDSHENVLQFGDPESVDTVAYKQNEMIISEGMRNSGNWQINGGLQRFKAMYNSTAPNRLLNIIAGNYIFGQGNIKEDATPVFPVNTVKNWVGPSLYQPIQANSEGSNAGNFELKTRFYFGAGVKEMNRVEFSIMSDNTETLPISFTVRNASNNSKEFVIEMWLYGKEVKTINLTPKKITKNFFELTITRLSDKVTFKFSEINNLAGEKVTAGVTVTNTLVSPTLKTEVFKGITIWNSVFQGKQSGLSNITDFKYSWINVDKLKDIPNVFKIGDVLWADTENGKIYLNGVYTPELDTFGNMWGNFRVGANTQEYITVVESSWVTEITKPLYTAKIREVWV